MNAEPPLPDPLVPQVQLRDGHEQSTRYMLPSLHVSVAETLHAFPPPLPPADAPGLQVTGDPSPLLDPCAPELLPLDGPPSDPPTVRPPHASHASSDATRTMTPRGTAAA